MRGRRALLVLLAASAIVAAASTLFVGGVFGLFSSTTTNSGSTFSASSCFQDVQISLSNFKFTPASITIDRGCTVRWTNTSATKHTTTSDTGLWDSGQLNQNQTFTRQFSSSGTFTYKCTIHPATMTATIVVN
jgi:plastocyanin